MLIYVAGPYSAPTSEGISENIQSARKVAIQLWEMGHAVICPQENTSHFEEDCECTYEQYIAGDLNIISRCDALVLAPGWTQSKGSQIELDYANSLNMPVYFWNELPDLHPTEVKSPEQVKCFRETMGIMYRLHLSKNQDYSPANVGLPGEMGLATREFDKSIRIMNLTGFNVLFHTNDNPKTLWEKFLWLLQGRLVVIDKIEYVEPRVPKHETLEENLVDLSVYSVIHRLFRLGKWGK